MCTYQIYQSYDYQDSFKNERMKLFYQFCRKVCISECSAQSEEMKTERNYLVFDSNPILLSRSSRSGAASYSNTVRFSEYFEIFVSVNHEL